ncbi:hypothetical protein NDA18_003241 [Ustilago nuda]|nr:hypothetical protein NDA18_003241 [Ustilago nuda]
MKDSKTPPLSDGSSACSKDSPFESTPTSLLPNYTDATGSAARPSNQVDQIVLTLKNASLKLCDGPGLTPEERKEVDKALTKGVQIALSSAKLDICNLDDLKAHLKLLNLFDRLRQHQEAEEAAAELSEQLKRERRWNISLNRAAYRMEIWFNQILVSDAVNKHFDHVILVKEKAALRGSKAKDIDGEDVEKLLEGLLDNAHDLPDFALPPLDVALMLHSYHLNPLAKEEDDQRLNLQPPPEHPTHAQETNGGDIFGLRVKCPRCHKTQFVPWTGQGKDPSKLGIGELGCERLGRFLQDFKRWSKSPGRKFEGKQVFFMAGTMPGPAHAQYSSRDYFGEALLTPIFLHEKPAVAMPHKDHHVAKSASLQDIEQVGVQCNYSMKTFRAWFEVRWMGNAITPKLKSDEEKSRQMARIAMLMRSYQNGNAAAYGEGLCDVVDGVKRQTSFNLEMFLELMASVATLLTLTLDIDLCWHTHQLKSRYYSHCFTLVGRFVNHDNAIETGILKVAFDRTASLWKDRYGQPYSMCGCIYNDSGALKKLKGLLGSGSNSSGKEASESAPTKFGFASRLKGKWRAAKGLPGDKPQDDATATTEEEHRHDKLRGLMVKEWAQGKRREGHEGAFVFGYDTPGLYPFYYSPLYSTHYVSRESTGDTTHNAYSMYGVYGMMAVSGLGMGMAAGGGMAAFEGAGCGGGGS